MLKLLFNNRSTRELLIRRLNTRSTRELLIIEVTEKKSIMDILVGYISAPKVTANVKSYL